MKLLRRFFIFCIFGFINDSEAAVLENIYNVENTGSKTTIIDSILTNAFSYIGKIEEDFFIIEKKLSGNSDHQAKFLPQLIFVIIVILSFTLNFIPPDTDFWMLVKLA